MFQNIILFFKVYYSFYYFELVIIKNILILSNFNIKIKSTNMLYWQHSYSVNKSMTLKLLYFWSKQVLNMTSSNQMCSKSIAYFQVQQIHHICITNVLSIYSTILVSNVLENICYLNSTVNVQFHSKFPNNNFFFGNTTYPNQMNLNEIFQNKFNPSYFRDPNETLREEPFQNLFLVDNLKL